MHCGENVGENISHSALNPRAMNKTSIIRNSTPLHRPHKAHCNATSQPSKMRAHIAVRGCVQAQRGECGQCR